MHIMQGLRPLNATAYSLDFDPAGAVRVLQMIRKMETGLLGFTAVKIVEVLALLVTTPATIPYNRRQRCTYLYSPSPCTAFTPTGWGCPAPAPIIMSGR
jgi:hypothetical protein